MFAARATTLARSLCSRRGLVPTTASAGRVTNVATKNSAGAKRNMGGGAHWMEVSRPHAIAGEVCGFFAWIWIFYRAKEDLPVVLGMRHPWEHAEDPWQVHDHVENLDVLENEWEEFNAKATRPGEDDDDDDDEDEDDDDDDEEEDDDDE
mmetsp:Transcript_20270/g.31906  ORF Transcript_20270/g.31906 Transcript_20270/m.31906 type:complete len:150 (-) Transcript_20270:184-633(-)|eukprot:CAMPEP_0201608470 /NCGR_PEP_ID=MMETSP0492-20130828/7393_1 /ASSEMBLY_ACC=CAM_ASM_000837 /TAXON_ID=420259 /ORGANISM="Thalassiosira gravida, Strain GMp14c1" /LENGTH=149 /DNA_ID=CAMNT_0048073257 /DNA_START=138 /DNA_END=587 /DNA_ORIENTATION=+